ncbi:MAG: hypothetical protein Q9219_002268 [cf. Caloplaca sp. 3 TL-2023]
MNHHRGIQSGVLEIKIPKRGRSVRQLRKGQLRCWQIVREGSQEVRTTMPADGLPAACLSGQRLQVNETATFVSTHRDTPLPVRSVLEASPLPQWTVTVLRIIGLIVLVVTTVIVERLRFRAGNQMPSKARAITTGLKLPLVKSTQPWAEAKRSDCAILAFLTRIHCLMYPLNRPPGSGFIHSQGRNLKGPATQVMVLLIPTLTHSGDPPRLVTAFINSAEVAYLAKLVALNALIKRAAHRWVGQGIFSLHLCIPVTVTVTTLQPPLFRIPVIVLSRISTRRYRRVRYHHIHRHSFERKTNARSVIMRFHPKAPMVAKQLAKATLLSASSGILPRRPLALLGPILQQQLKRRSWRALLGQIKAKPLAAATLRRLTSEDEARVRVMPTAATTPFRGWGAKGDDWQAWSPTWQQKKIAWVKKGSQQNV